MAVKTTNIVVRSTKEKKRALKKIARKEGFKTLSACLDDVFDAIIKAGQDGK